MRGLSFSSFDLKLFALIFMVLDHIGIFFAGAPLWLRYVGRLSFPLFLFCLVWSYHYTHSRVRFCLRLYVMGLFMAALGWWVDQQWPDSGGLGGHNIFVPMLLVCLLISVLEQADRDKLRCGLLLALLLAVQLAYFIVPRYVPQLRHISGNTLTGLFPNLALHEFGFAFVALGVAMYFLKERPARLAAAYLAFCVWQFSNELLHAGWPPIQCVMFLALPFMLAYNRRRGRGWKWFFYLFYPAHMFILFYLAKVVWQ